MHSGAFYVNKCRLRNSMVAFSLHEFGKDKEEKQRIKALIKTIDTTPKTFYSTNKSKPRSKHL